MKNLNFLTRVVLELGTFLCVFQLTKRKPFILSHTFPAVDHSIGRWLAQVMNIWFFWPSELSKRHTLNIELQLALNSFPNAPQGIAVSKQMFNIYPGPHRTQFVLMWISYLADLSFTNMYLTPYTINHRIELGRAIFIQTNLIKAGLRLCSIIQLYGWAQR